MGRADYRAFAHSSDTYRYRDIVIRIQNGYFRAILTSLCIWLVMTVAYEGNITALIIVKILLVV